MVAERLARVGVALQCERVELLRITDNDTARLDAWWASLEHPSPAIPPTTDEIPLNWFPWDLGNVFSVQYMFVRNAEALYLHPADELRVGDMGFSSVIHIALNDGGTARGALCCYWRQEQRRPGTWSWSGVVDLGLAALDHIA